MIHPPKWKESQNQGRGNPNDSGFKSDDLDASYRPKGYERAERETRSYVRAALRNVTRITEGVA